MKNVKGILFLSDGRTTAEFALLTARETARRAGARLTAAALLEDGELLTELQRSERRASLAALLEEARLDDDSTRTMLIDGDAATAVPEAVRQHGFDLVIKRADRDTDTALIRSCPVPVWAVRRAGTSRVLAAIDPFAEGEEVGLNLGVLDQAASIARLWSAELHVVSSWSPRGVDALAGARRMAALETDARRAQRRELDRRAAPAQDPSHVHLVAGSPAEVVSEIASREQADLIVAGTVARQGVAGLVIGNTAERLLRRSDCSLLVVPVARSESPDRARQVQSTAA